jgi:hypothetical protein
VRKAENVSPSNADVTESGSLNLPEPSGPHRAVMGMFCHFTAISCVMFVRQSVRMEHLGCDWTDFHEI